MKLLKYKEFVNESLNENFLQDVPKELYKKGYEVLTVEDGHDEDELDAFFNKYEYVIDLAHGTDTAALVGCKNKRDWEKAKKIINDYLKKHPDSGEVNWDFKYDDLGSGLNTFR